MVQRKQFQSLADSPKELTQGRFTHEEQGGHCEFTGGTTKGRQRLTARLLSETCRPHSHQSYSISSSTIYAMNGRRSTRATQCPSHGFHAPDDTSSFVSNFRQRPPSNHGLRPFRTPPTLPLIAPAFSPCKVSPPSLPRVHTGVPGFKPFVTS
jgi:hypothetical protein